MKSVFVTGATGSLGSNVCEQLVAKSDHLRAIVRDAGREEAQSLDLEFSYVMGRMRKGPGDTSSR